MPVFEAKKAPPRPRPKPTRVRPKKVKKAKKKAVEAPQVNTTAPVVQETVAKPLVNAALKKNTPVPAEIQAPEVNTQTIKPTETAKEAPTAESKQTATNALENATKATPNTKDIVVLKTGASPKGIVANTPKAAVPAVVKTAKETPVAPAAAQETTEEAPAVSPLDNPNFVNVVGSIGTVASAQAKHKSTQKSTAEAQQAAPAPANERLSTAQASQVEVMDEQEAGEFSAADFKKQLEDRIAQMQLPANEEEADNFEENNNIDEVNEKALGDVSATKDNASGAIESTTAAAPNTAAVPARVVKDLPTPQYGKQPKIAGVAKAMPPTRSSAQVEQPIAEQTSSLDSQMETHGVSDEMLANSNEPSFTAALDEKNNAQAQSAAATQAFRGQEATEQENVQNQAEQATQNQVGGMHAARTTGLKNVAGNQKGTAQKNSAARKKIADKVNSIYNKTKTEVDTLLDSLDAEVATKFTTGAKHARLAFEAHVAVKMAAYKKERYGEWYSWKQLKRTKDFFAGLPKEVNDFFVTGRDVYIKTMDVYITSIANLVAQKLNKAKRLINKGKTDVKTYIDGLAPELKKLGKEAAANIEQKFNGLEQSVDDKKEALIEALAEKYAENLASVDARIEELKAANEGLINKALGALKGVFEFIIKVKNTLTNLLAKIVEVVVAIITDPIGFFKNLIAGVGQGISNFGSNIMKHLQTGFFGWLTGAMRGVTIEMPENIFSLKGIFSIVLQLLGLGWQGIRAIGAKVIGEPIMKVLETGVEIVQIVRKDGVAGLWEHLKDQFNDLKTVVMDAIMDLIQTQVIQAGIKWILGLLSPVGAFIKAAMAIVDVVKFFIERAAQIAELVNAFIDSVAAIASGKVSAVAEAIENALGKAIPVLIGLLASILGIGGLAKKVMGVIRKIQQRITKAITKFWLKVKKVGKKLLRKLGIGKKKKKDEKDKAKKVDYEIGEEIDFKAAGESHELWFKEEGPGVELWVASNDPKRVSNKLKDWKSRTGDADDKETKEKKGLIKSVEKRAQKVELDAADFEKLVLQQEKSSKRSQDPNLTKKQLKAKNAPILKQEKLISKELTRLFELFGEQDQIGGETPKVGIHPLKGKFRESHHVAENSFMEQIKEFYGVVGEELEKEESPFKNLGVKLTSRNQAIKSNFKGGNNLSAILLHRETHRTAKGKAVHASGLQKAVQKNIEESVYKNKKVTVLGVKSDGVKKAQMFEGDWKSFIKRVYDLVKEDQDFILRENDDEVIIESKERDKEALNEISSEINGEINQVTKDDELELELKKDEILKRINDTATNSYESALNSGLQTVKTALSKSTFDGDEKDHPGVIDKLKEIAERIWTNDIVKEIE